MHRNMCAALQRYEKLWAANMGILYYFGNAVGPAVGCGALLALYTATAFVGGVGQCMIQRQAHMNGIFLSFVSVKCLI